MSDVAEPKKQALIVHDTEFFEIITAFSGLGKDKEEPLLFEMHADGDLNLCNPKGKATCLLLWLYSLEPQFYTEMNKAIISYDESKADTLGPYVQALFSILLSTE